MKKNFLNFIFIAGLLGAAGSCSWNKMDGVYKGTLKEETKLPVSYEYGAPTMKNDEETGLLVFITQENNDVFIKITGSRLLGDCNLRADLGKKSDAIIRIPQTCSNSSSLDGSLVVGNAGNLLFTLRSYGQNTNQTFRFEGWKK
jgi:hypothetical protein